MTRNFQHLNRFVLATERLSTQFTAETILSLLEQTDQLHLVSGINITQQGHHFEILVNDYDTLYRLSTNGLDDPISKLHISLHPLEPPTVVNLTNVPLEATTEMVTDLLQCIATQPFAFVNATQGTITYRDYTIMTGKWTLTVWESLDATTPMTFPKYSKYFPSRFVGIHHQFRRKTSQAPGLNAPQQQPNNFSPPQVKHLKLVNSTTPETPPVFNANQDHNLLLQPGPVSFSTNAPRSSSSETSNNTAPEKSLAEFKYEATLPTSPTTPASQQLPHYFAAPQVNPAKPVNPTTTAISTKTFTKPVHNTYIYSEDPFYSPVSDNTQSTNSEQSRNITKAFLPRILGYELANTNENAQFNLRLMADFPKDILGPEIYAALDKLHNRREKIITLYDAIGNSVMTKDDTDYDIALLHYLER